MNYNINRKLRPGIRIFILAVCIFQLAGNAHGQLLSAGFFGGITAAQVDGDSYSGFNKLGLTAGVFINRHIVHKIYWQIEMKYVTRGVYKGPGDNDPTLYKSGYHYLELPISVHYLYEKKLQVELGTSPEILLMTYFWDENGLIDRSNYPENRRFGLSVFGGLYYWFNGKTGVGMRFTYSAIPFRDPQEWNHPRYRGYFHSVISLTGAYKFMPK